MNYSSRINIASDQSRCYDVIALQQGKTPADVHSGRNPKKGPVRIGGWDVIAVRVTGL